MAFANSRMGVQPHAVIDFVRAFPGRGALATHDKSFDKLVPAAELVREMRRMAYAGGEYDSADLLLVRD